MTPTCINRTDRKPEYFPHQGVDLRSGARIVLRSVTDDDGQLYTQQFNLDGNWSEWHAGEWPGDANTAFLFAPTTPMLTYPVTVPPGVTVTSVTTNIPTTVTTNIPATKLTTGTYSTKLTTGTYFN